MTWPGAVAGRFVAVLPLLAVAGLSLSDYGAFRRERDRMLQTLDAAGISERVPEARVRIEREPDEFHLALAAARSLLSDAFARQGGEGLPERLAGVEMARVLADGAMVALPVAFQGPMLSGGATLLARQETRDPALYTETRDWESRIRYAMELGPGQAEPRRLLAVGKLFTWFALSDAERAESRELLAELFESDQSELERLMEAWIATASTVDEALSIVPPRPQAWQWVEHVFASTGRWELAADARRREWDTVLTTYGAMTDAAERDLAAGKVQEARALYAEVLRALPADLGNVGLFERAVAGAPPGPASASVEQALARWVLWDLRLSTVRPPPLGEATFRRIAGLAALDPPTAAWAAIGSGDLANGERLERNAEEPGAPSWSPYLVAKARLLHDRGRDEEARLLLQDVEPALRRSPWFLRLQADVLEGLGRDASAAREVLRATSASRWPAAAWRLDDDGAWLELWPEARAAGLTLSLVPMSGEGSVVDIAWDGGLLRSHGLPAATIVSLPVEVTPEPHVLMVRRVEGARVVPGEVELTAVP